MSKDKWEIEHSDRLEKDFHETGRLRSNPYSERTIKYLDKKYGKNPFNRSRSDKGE